MRTSHRLRAPASGSARHARGRRLCAAAVAAAVLAGGVVLYRFPPSQTPFYPPCLFHALTGLHCPGCGTARALHALLHGRVGAALGHNAFTVLSLPFLAWAAVSMARQAAVGRPLPCPRLSAASTWALFAAIVAFWVLRNVPLWPCSLLAP
ncbi:MAG: DUF2752 domain-containing protein [bacterium]